MATVGERLRGAREHSGLSRAEAAGRLGMSASGLQRWELGSREARAGDLCRLATLYGTTVGELLGERPLEAQRMANDGGSRTAPSDRELLFELAAAVRASARALEVRVTEVEAAEARALELAQKNIDRMMAYLPEPSPHAADRHDEEAVSDGY